ncbi:type IV toxin-antitoxin system AbiEi family antitoxin domain-containing protein [soil metagenome]
MDDCNVDILRHQDIELRSVPAPLAQLGTVFRPRDLAAVGMTPDQLPSLVRQGVVERVGRGLYRVVDELPTENYTLAMACARVSDGIVCLLTALRVHGLGTQAPSAVWMAIPQRSRTPRVRDLRIRFVRFSGPATTYGVIDTAFEGVPARITSPARTIVDCFRLARHVGPEPGVEALRDALARRVVTMDELARVESVLPSRKLRAHLEVAAIGA